MTRIVAIFFLLWTGVDLLNPAVSAIDQDTQAQDRADGYTDARQR